jgi:hypothetical protein
MAYPAIGTTDSRTDPSDQVPQPFRYKIRADHGTELLCAPWDRRETVRGRHDDGTGHRDGRAPIAPIGAVPDDPARQGERTERRSARVLQNFSITQCDVACKLTAIRPVAGSPGQP